MLRRVPWLSYWLVVVVTTVPGVVNTDSVLVPLVTRLIAIPVTVWVSVTPPSAVYVVKVPVIGTVVPSMYWFVCRDATVGVVDAECYEPFDVAAGVLRLLTSFDQVAARVISVLCDVAIRRRDWSPLGRRGCRLWSSCPLRIVSS